VIDPATGKPVTKKEPPLEVQLRLAKGERPQVIK